MTRTCYELHELEKKLDSRGWLVEVVRELPAGSQTYVFTIGHDAIRGNHWHGRKTEWFCCVAGAVRVRLESIEDGASSWIAEEELDSDRPALLVVPPRIRHTFFGLSSQPAIVLAAISESFDPLDPDTHYEAQP